MTPSACMHGFGSAMLQQVDLHRDCHSARMLLGHQFFLSSHHVLCVAFAAAFRATVTVMALCWTETHLQKPRSATAAGLDLYARLGAGDEQKGSLAGRISLLALVKQFSFEVQSAVVQTFPQ